MGPHESCPAIGDRSVVALASAGSVPLAPGELRVVRSVAEARVPGPSLVEVGDEADLMDAVGASDRCVGLWAREGLGPGEVVRAFAAASERRSPGIQLVVGLDTVAGPDAVIERLGHISRQAGRFGLAPQRVAASVVIGPGDDAAGLLGAWRTDPLAARHPLVIAPASTLGRAQRLGVMGRALLEGAAVATDDLRGARRVLEVLSAIDARTAAPSVAQPMVGRAS